jgi:hypothetical protein
MGAGAARGRGGGKEGGGVAGAVHLPVVAGKQGLGRLQPATTTTTITTTIAHCSRRESNDFVPLPLLHDFHVKSLKPERKEVKLIPSGGGGGHR